jgi:hypothetical protein
MAQFRTTADIVDSVLRRAGETTNGNSAFESDALEYLNRVHHAILSGGNIFDLSVDESWVWARSKEPMTLELQPSRTSGTVSVTIGSESCVFSSAPADSLEGWFLKCDGRDEVYRIVHHNAAATAFELDAAYLGATNAAQIYTAFKLDYELVPSYITINVTNNKLEFEEVASTPLTATLTHGSYTPSQLATHVAARLQAAGSTPTYGCTYDNVLKTFSLTSNLTGPKTFKLLFASGAAQSTSAHRLLGFDDEDLSSATSHVGKYPLGAVSRLIEPLRLHRSSEKDALIEGIDSWRFLADYPMHRIEQGMPDRFTKIQEDQDGRITLRMNKYPSEKKRLEVHWIPVPRDLKDNTASRPLLPRKDVDVLEYGATYYLCLDKEDSKADTYLALAKQGLMAMEKRNRDEFRKTDSNFGEIVTRPEQLSNNTRFRYGYTAED